MGVKIFDWQGFHLIKHLCSDIPHGALTHIDHNSVVYISRYHADCIEACHAQNCLRKPGEIWVLCS